MLSIVLAIMVAAWLSRTVMSSGAVTPALWASAFAADLGAGFATNLLLLVLGFSLAGGGSAGESLFFDGVVNGVWIAALGSAAGLLGAWWRGFNDGAIKPPADKLP